MENSTPATPVSPSPHAFLTKYTTPSTINVFALKILFGSKAKTNAVIPRAQKVNYGMDLAANLFLVLLDPSSMELNVFAHNSIPTAYLGKLTMAKNVSTSLTPAHKAQDGTKAAVYPRTNVH